MSTETPKPDGALPDTMPQYWLMKSEPDVYSLDDLERDGTTFWDGVRNFEARNLMRDAMKTGDLAFFYHSNATPSAVAGVMEVVGGARPDPTAFDPRDVHYDPKSKRESPTWFGVEVAFCERFPRPVALQALKGEAGLAEMALFKRARLSVTPVAPKEWKRVVAMGRA